MLCFDPEFQRWVEDRRLIDLFESEAYDPSENGPEPQKVAPRRGVRKGVVRIVTNRVDTLLVDAWREIPTQTAPLPDFRVGAFGDGRWKLPEDASVVEREVARLIQARLPCDGLLNTAAQAIRALGDYRNDLKTAGRLRRAGFPIGLLRYFDVGSGKSILDVITEGRTNELARATFKFERTEPDFEPAIENGEADLSLVRVQIGGGFRKGIIPGSGFDVAGKLIEALPDTRFIMSVDEEFVDLVQYQALTSWNLRRRGQLTLIGEPLPVSGWAQDNGKGGIIRDGARAFPAVLAPRYASIGEAESLFMPGESFLLAGLVEDGIRVFHSPLLFQGGNLLLVRDPARNQRLLLISQSEINRNLSLGLNSEQILSAFKIEFAVDRAIILPLVSYHLDYDITCRSAGDKLTALMNDPVTLSRSIVRVGAAALARGGLLSETDHAAIVASLGGSEESHYVDTLGGLLENHRNPDKRFSDRLEKCFKLDGADSPSANLACFCIALDWLSAANPEKLPAATSETKRNYLAALQRKLFAIIEQRKILEAEGFQTIAIPSMPDLSIGMNYLNGVHDRARFLMPAYGGFYSELDQAAAKTIAGHFGETMRVIPIPCADMQREHGALHCMVSIFPAETASP